MKIVNRLLQFTLLAALVAGGCKKEEDEVADGAVGDGGKDASVSDSDGPVVPDSSRREGGADAAGWEVGVKWDLGDLNPHMENIVTPDQQVNKDGPPKLPDVAVKYDTSSGPVSGSIGPAGGTLTSADGKALLLVWAGSLSTFVTFTIKTGMFWGNLDQGYEFGPAATMFSKQALVRITYDPKKLQGANEADLKLGTLTGGTTWTTVPGSTVDVKANQVTGMVSTLGVFGVICPGCQLDAGVPDGTPNDAVKTDTLNSDALTDAPAPLPDIYNACKHPSVTKNCSNNWCQIPAGCFVMGSPSYEKCRNADEDLHLVTLQKKFEIMDSSVTQGQFKSVMGYDPSFHTSCGTSCPVENITWHEAAQYCNTLSLNKGYTQCYSCVGSKSGASCSPKYAGKNIYQCPGFRLPTEAEWEYAYRAGTTTPYYNGQITSCTGNDPNAGAIGWYASNSGGKTHPVRQKTPNAWGLYDLSGNVYDWTNDWYIKSLGNKPLTDPTGPSVGNGRAFRGGSWFCYPRTMRAARRSSYAPTLHYKYLGLRCVRSN